MEGLAAILYAEVGDKVGITFCLYICDTSKAGYAAVFMASRLGYRN